MVKLFKQKLIKEKLSDFIVPDLENKINIKRDKNLIKIANKATAKQMEIINKYF